MARSTSLPHRTVRQARALLWAAEGLANEEIARRSAADSDTVRAWRRRFEERGVGGVGLIAKGRGRRPWLPEGTVPEVVRVTQQELPPDGATHWSTRSMAKRFGVGKDTVARILAGQRAKALEGRALQDIQRPSLRREARRRRGPLPGPTQASGAVQFRREDPGPGARPHPALPAHAAGPGGHHDPRLQAQRAPRGRTHRASYPWRRAVTTAV